MASLPGLDQPFPFVLPEGVEKEILTEAPTYSLEQPRKGDVVTVELEVSEGVSAAARTWVLGDTQPLEVGGLDVDQLVRSMRDGERAAFSSGGPTQPVGGVRLRLMRFERCEDLLGDGSMVRMRAMDGVEHWDRVAPGCELELTYRWRPAPPRVERGGREATTTVLLGGDPMRRGEASASLEMDDLRRQLLRRFKGAVVVRGQDAASQKPVLRLLRGEEVLLDCGEEGMEVKDVLRHVECLEPATAAWGDWREEIVRLEASGCRCSDDFLQGYLGLRALQGLWARQRCVLRVLKEEGEMECEMEVKRTIVTEDVSALLVHGRSGVASKRVLRRGDGGTPIEGCNARFLVRQSGAARELEVKVANGEVCAAVDEVLTTMRSGEECEVSCSESSLFAGDEFLQEGTFSLELLSFVELVFAGEKERLAHFARRKELGTRFFQEGSWYRALRRYAHVTKMLTSDDDDAKSLKRLCKLNMAAAYLKLSAWREAEACCGEVLAEEPNNSKALFRSGQAFMEMGDHGAAERCARAVLKEEPANKEAARLAAKARKSRLETRECERALLARMVGAAPAAAVVKEEEAAVVECNKEEGAWWPWIMAAASIGIAAGLVACTREAHHAVRWRN